MTIRYRGITEESRYCSKTAMESLPQIYPSMAERKKMAHSHEASRQACTETSHVQVRLQLWASYVNFVALEKAFESVDRRTLWKLL